ncbi:MAG TPA: mechanosensitive ion channel family protein [Candidatus Bathyarchaeia archaeon]|nr:mechanosensitive ion channel family protein [Candidatus Bathyarchaeia archaeon]
MLERLALWADAHTPNAIRVALILALAWLVSRGLRSLIKRIETIADDGDPNTVTELEKRAHTISRILRQASFILVWSVTIMLVLAELGVDLKPILAGAGILGLAIGFGAQTLVKDVITGFFILLENQIRVGDVVTAAGMTGEVEAVNLRTTVLRDADGKTHIIPNSAITVVTNATRDFSRALLDVGVSYREDTDRAMMVMREVGSAMEKDPVFARKLIGSFEYPGIQAFGESAILLRMVGKTNAQDGPIVQRELRRRVKKAFDQAGIEIPYPHLRVLTDK